jgi:hypothetical protein
MGTNHPRQRQPLEDLIFMFEQPHLERRRGIMARRFEEDRSAVLPTATAIQEKPCVAPQFFADLVARERHEAPV